MIYRPDPKALAFSELQFISTSVKKPLATPCMESIFDEVSREVFNLFVDGIQETATTIHTVNTGAAA